MPRADLREQDVHVGWYRPSHLQGVQGSQQPEQFYARQSEDAGMSLTVWIYGE